MSPGRLDILSDRSRMFSLARFFFAERSLIEVDPCAITRYAPVDAHIDAIEVQVTPEEEGYLHPSPEYAMKKLLVQLRCDLYFLGHVYRKGEKGRLHNPEFTMAEWYRLGFSLEEMLLETCEFLTLFLGVLPLRILSYKEAFRLYAGVDVDRGDFSALAPAHENSWSQSDKRHYVLSHVVEPKLGDGELTAIVDYPPEEAALARVMEKDGERVAERFEIYYRGVELANGYRELSDTTILRRRFEEENTLRARLRKKTYRLDDSFLFAMGQGLPDCSGVSVGFDRALMLRHGVRDIASVLPSCW